MKKLKEIKSSLIFGILAMLCVSFITVDVQAAKVTCKLNEDYLLGEFSPSLSQQSDGKFTLKIGKDHKVNGKTVKFTITKVNGSTPPSALKDKEVYFGKNIKDIDVLNNLKNGEYTITLHSADTGDCKEFENKCPSKSKQITSSTQCKTEIDLNVTIEGEKDQYLESASLSGDPEVGDWDYTNAITCKESELEQYRLESSYNYTGNRTHGIFKSRFCYAKIAAEKEGNSQNIGDSDVVKTQPATLKCDTFVLNKADVGNIKNTSVKRMIEQDMSDGYMNAKYFEAIGTKTYKTDTGYIRHLDPNTTVEGDKLQCKLSCTETVKVLYEPPRASKAGFCFDYKVKVESYVNCEIAEYPVKPNRADYEYCYPSPLCAHSGASGVSYYLQGGPNEDYEACIKSCDGGKYTQACSNSCYNKVYASLNNTSKLSLVTAAEYSVQQLKAITVDREGINNEHLTLAQCKAKVSNGCYYRSGGSIKFSANKRSRGGSSYAPGTWYVKAGAPHHYKYNDSAYIVPWQDGFYRANYGGGSFCHDNCHWVEGKCAGKYLNAGSGQAEADWEANKALYKKIVDTCRAAASCTKSSATFTITADYTNAEADYHVDYPSGKVTKDLTHDSTDKLNSNDSTDKCTTTNTTTSCSKKNIKVETDKDKFNVDKLEKCNKTKSTIKDYAGCYVCSQAKNYYMTEWTFPGTWVNNKTGEISFEAKSEDDGWREEKGKFCIPLDTKNVNAKWWLWYMKKVYGTDYTTTEQYEDKCNTYMADSLETLRSKATVEKYNIHAETKDFGYYKWNIKMDCFYAINDTAKTKKSGSSTDEDKCKTTATNYRIKDIDLENMFPSSTGNSSVQERNTSFTGRLPGFNWTSQATITADKDPYIATNPSVLIGEIQGRGKSIYEKEEYLDYEFELTPTALNAIKTWTKGMAYSTPYSDRTGSADNTSAEANKYFKMCGRAVYHSTLIDKLIAEYNDGSTKWRKYDINTKTACCSNVNPKTGECEQFIVASEGE